MSRPSSSDNNRFCNCVLPQLCHYSYLVLGTYVLYDLVLGFGQLEDVGDNTVQHFLDLFRLIVITHS